MNFKGFVPAGKRGNEGEDRGHTIDTARDLMPRFSSCLPDQPKGLACYRVVASRGNQILGEITVEVAPAKLDYLVIRRDDGHKMVYYDGGTLRAAPGERLEVVDLKSNVEAGAGLRLALSARKRTVDLDTGQIDTSAPSFTELCREDAQGVNLVVLREEMVMGQVRLSIGEEKRGGK